MRRTVVLTLLRHHWRQHRLPLAPMMGALALFQFLLTRIAPEPNQANWMTGLIAMAPPQLMALAGNEFTITTPAGFLSIGYGHPFVLLLLSVWVVRLSSVTIAGEIGRGTMDLVASRPVSRGQLLTASALALAAGLVLLIAAAWTGTAIGVSLRPLGLSGSTFFPVVLSTWCLFAAAGAVGFLISATRRDGGSAIAWTSAFLATSFVLEYLARLWHPIEWLRPLSIFAYYSPSHTVTAGIDVRHLLTLGAVTVAAILLAGHRLTKRDL